MESAINTLYHIGDVIEYRVFSDLLRVVRVTARHRNIKNGRPGFDGVEIVNGQTGSFDCWGYDYQVTRVIIPRKQVTPQLSEGMQPEV